MNPSSPEINQPPIQSPEINIPIVDPNLPVPEDEATRESLDQEIADLKEIESAEDLNDNSSISSQNVSNFNRISQPGVKVTSTNPDSDLANKYLQQISK
jgi:hypothetical protein